ncbi:beta-lactamase superfamily domain-domain-containing protein [Clohesyomyces aquaticus]|uniref:Beta-lactamase superfamily domain-domain-containing protein n=1 Tax=Clohesyomyces aquaticus TaxID=1231657 RepID=A0A1Y1YHW9_9PLEO|nr:beta-lactamase superfamily domain-domain-containing protein [Clohesyomyces aquaticus]
MTSSTPTKCIHLTPSLALPPTRSTPRPPSSLPAAKHTHHHPSTPSPSNASDPSDSSNASLLFIGTATTILSWANLRILTDPNFLHAGSHIHLGPGVTSTRLTNPAISLHELPRIDAVLLSHYHADHFDEGVENELRRDLPIITTPHAKECLTEGKGSDAFTAVTAVDVWERVVLVGEETGEGDIRGGIPRIRVTAMPGKHVPPGPLSIANDLLGAVPPTNGWLLELGYSSVRDDEDADFTVGYRIYISGDTLLIPELASIPQRYADQGIDLILIHLGGTTIPGPKLPLLMVTMDAVQGVKLMQLVNPDVTIPIHYDDYDVFLSPLEDFRKAVEEAGLGEKVVYLDRKGEFGFTVRRE